jgi:hypothetical protein
MEDYKCNIRNFIVSSNNKISLDFKGFVEYLKVKKETFGLIPIDVFYDDFCTKEELRKIEESFDEEKEIGGYTRLFLEYLFDERFKKGFNNMVKEKLKPALTNSYFSTKDEKGLFSFDLVGRYLEDIKGSYRGADTGFDFSTITKRGAVYDKNDEERKGKTKNISGWTEPLKNPYSMYKLYGQEKYSRILISLQAKSTPEILPDFLLGKSNNVFFSDKIIKENIPALETINPIEIREQVYFLWLDKIRYDLQTFFDDYIPSTLDTIIKKKSDSKFNEQTFRESMYIGFKTILKEEKALYCNEAGQNKFDYLRLSNGRRTLFSDSELITINKEFKELYKKDDTEEKPNILDYTIREKLEFIIKKTSKHANKKWEDFLDRYNIYFSEDPNEYSGVEKKEYREEEHRISTQSPEEKFFQGYDDNPKELLIKLFRYYFQRENQFLEFIEKVINKFSYSTSELIQGFRGLPDHPWARFWTVYRRNSEIDLYQKQAHFTKVMNCIEAKMMENLNA